MGQCIKQNRSSGNDSHPMLPRLLPAERGREKRRREAEREGRARDRETEGRVVARERRRSMETSGDRREVRERIY